MPRNAACPCGSGRKHKLCCGTTRAQEREIERQTAALLAATRLPELFPLLRPECRKFDEWAEKVVGRWQAAAEGPSQRLLEEAVDTLAHGERERIARWPRETIEIAWTELCREADEERLVTALLAASVTVGLNERAYPLDVEMLELLEKEERTSPAEALAYVLEPSDLWSPPEAQVLDAALERLPEDLDDDDEVDALWTATVAEVAAALATPRHRRRLVRLVGYVRRCLPVDGLEQASSLVSEACDAFQRDRGVRSELAALLLEDSL